MQLGLDVFICICSSFFCFAAGLLVLRRIPVAFRLLVIQAFLSCAMDTLGVVAIQVFKYTSNAVFFNVYMPFEFFLMLFATRMNFGKSFRTFSIFSISIYTVAWMWTLSINGPFIFANQVLILSGILITIAYFMVLLRNVQEEHSHHTTGIYCISVSVILYYCCTIPHFGLINYFTNTESILAGYYVNNVLSVLRYLFTGIGLIFLSRPVSKPVHAYK